MLKGFLRLLENYRKMGSTSFMQKEIPAFFLLFVFFMGGCSITPKGNYSNSLIDRPYALPDDIATVTFGGRYEREELKDASDSATGKKEEDEVVLPRLYFEHGIGKSFSWIYPIGLKWGIYQNDKHLLGVSLLTYLVHDYYSVDYWYRVGESFSIRPYHRGERFQLLLVNRSHRFSGAEFLYQANDKLSLGLYGHMGNYTASSPMFEAIVKGITNSDDPSTKVTSDFKEAGFRLMYSMSESWDINAALGMASYDFDDFETTSIRTNFSLSYIW